MGAALRFFSALSARPRVSGAGDCFYMSVEAALSEAQGWQPFYSVAAMREVVASRLTEEIFQLYTLLHAQQADGESLPKSPKGPTWPLPAPQSPDMA
tara:strand:+ start:278 stop:568 length:291 start_codon:yes stop_codon:yes gene_type:complete